MIALALLCLSLIALFALGHTDHGQRPLNDRTRAEARQLREALRKPMIAVKASQRDLRELGRIPDPESLELFRAILLQPNAYSAPVRRVAAQTLAQFRGASDEKATRILHEALGREKVREVVSELGRALEAKAPIHSRYLARIPSHVKILE